MRTLLVCLIALLSSVQVAEPQRADTRTTIASVDKALANAMVKADVATLADTYADDYVFTDPTGRVSRKSELLEGFRRGVIKIRSQEIGDVQVNVYGNVAVEIGYLVSRATRDGKESGGSFRFTRVWVNRAGRWQTVAFQETRVVPRS